MKYQRAPVEAIQYEMPTAEMIPFVIRAKSDREGRAANLTEYESTQKREKAFAADASIKALATFVAKAKTRSGKKAKIGKTAEWGRDNFTISVDTATGTSYAEPGDWLILDGNQIRVIPKDRFEAEFT